jgi:FtsP/CotA-like multicopper oxidase with cupredoxin domain
MATGLPSAQSPSLRKFIQMLPGLGPSGIPVATSVPYLGADYYRLTAGEHSQQLHPQLSPTRLWGYADTTTGVHRHLGPVIAARRGTPVRLTLTNQLPPIHPLPVDTSLPGAELPPNTQAGFGPNTRTVLQMVVGPRTGAKDPHAPLKLPPLDPAPLVPPASRRSPRVFG